MSAVLIYVYKSIIKNPEEDTLRKRQENVTQMTNMNQILSSD
jgi:hypothetical protein